jgi:polyphosphate kinase 2 (PPK2 family)
MAKHNFEAKKFRVKEGESIKLSKISTRAGNELVKKADGIAALKDDNTALQEAQNRLFAGGQRSLLVILQGMDASGKDGTVSHVINGVNPQGVRIYSFRAPNTEEVQHHFLWRPMRFLPSRGMIAMVGPVGAETQAAKELIAIRLSTARFIFNPSIYLFIFDFIHFVNSGYAVVLNCLMN